MHVLWLTFRYTQVIQSHFALGKWREKMGKLKQKPIKAFNDHNVGYNLPNKNPDTSRQTMLAKGFTVRKNHGKA